ncbi:hypothetical protein AXF42_Ash013429 [Apostasia shenzhenica]|uniref:Uncharacterized protein n=1 Tax=Apostasia shenzhenica TaxID=1088818 RepID=A0A2I0A470_9ASPA|nr:hypothetical protein AXF42_Ash013429 [Apostasia shenzhenica]
MAWRLPTPSPLLSHTASGSPSPSSKDPSVNCSSDSHQTPSSPTPSSLGPPKLPPPPASRGTPSPAPACLRFRSIGASL